MLYAVRAPLVLGDLGEDMMTLIQELVDDAVLRRLFQVLERMLGET